MCKNGLSADSPLLGTGRKKNVICETGLSARWPTFMHIHSHVSMELHAHGPLLAHFSNLRITNQSGLYTHGPFFNYFLKICMVYLHIAHFCSRDFPTFRIFAIFTSPDFNET